MVVRAAAHTQRTWLHHVNNQAQLQHHWAESVLSGKSARLLTICWGHFSGGASAIGSLICVLLLACYQAGVTRAQLASLDALTRPSPRTPDDSDSGASD